MGCRLGAENSVILFSFQDLSFQVNLHFHKLEPSLGSFTFIISMQSTRFPLNVI